MKKVFIYSNGKKDKPYTVIWKETGKTQDLNDVMLFNGEFKRYQNIQGWHGIISDEVNEHVISFMQNPSQWMELKKVLHLYYPRWTPANSAAKKVAVLRFLPKRIIGNYEGQVSVSTIKEWCKPWKIDLIEDEWAGHGAPR